MVKWQICFLALNDSEKYLHTFINPSTMMPPVLIFAADSAIIIYRRTKLKQAIFWYKMAAEMEKPVDSWGAVNHACWT